jgi:hypothetical protein
VEKDIGSWALDSVMEPSTHHPRPRSRHQSPQDRINVVGIPSVSIHNNHLDVGDSHSSQSLSPSAPLWPCSPCHSLSRLSEVIYLSQGHRRWLLRHRMALRLAWVPTSQHPLIPHAVRQQLQARVGWQAARRRQAHEEKVGGRLGRVPEAQRDRGRSFLFIVPDNRSLRRFA